VSEEKKMAETHKVVRYVGTSHVRRISKADWERAGIEHDTLEWTRDAPGNDIPLDNVKLDEEAFSTYINGDPDFQVVEVEDEPEETTASDTEGSEAV
jgi:hypothetical protein